MIYYENLDIGKIIDAMESFAYRVLRTQHPTWHSIPEEDVADLLREEGIDCWVE